MFYIKFLYILNIHFIYTLYLYILSIHFIYTFDLYILYIKLYESCVLKDGVQDSYNTHLLTLSPFCVLGGSS